MQQSHCYLLILYFSILLHWGPILIIYYSVCNATKSLLPLNIIFQDSVALQMEYYTIKIGTSWSVHYKNSPDFLLAKTEYQRKWAPSGGCEQNPKSSGANITAKLWLKTIMYLNTYTEANSANMAAQLKIKVCQNYLSHCASSAYVTLYNVTLHKRYLVILRPLIIKLTKHLKIHVRIFEVHRYRNWDYSPYFFVALRHNALNEVLYQLRTQNANVTLLKRGLHSCLMHLFAKNMVFQFMKKRYG
jgi:hypothetical protein